MGKIGELLNKIVFSGVGEPTSIISGALYPNDSKIISALAIAGQQPERLIAAFTQASTAAPTVATPKLNTLSPTSDSSDIVWTRAGEGSYVGTLTGNFTGVVVDKRIPIFSAGGITGWAVIAKIDDDSISLKTYGTGLPSELRYAVNLTQTTTGAPVVNSTAINQLLDTPVWARTGAGVYTATFTGAFNGVFAPKEGITVDANGDHTGFWNIVRTSDDVATLTTNQDTDGAAADSLLLGTDIDIELVPDADYNAGAYGTLIDDLLTAYVI